MIASREHVQLSSELERIGKRLADNYWKLQTLSLSAEDRSLLRRTIRKDIALQTSILVRLNL